MAKLIGTTGTSDRVPTHRRSLLAACGLGGLLLLSVIGTGQGQITEVKPNHHCITGTSWVVYFNMCWNRCESANALNPQTGSYCQYWCMDPRPVKYCSPVQEERTCTQTLTFDPAGDCGERRVNGTISPEGCCINGTLDGRCCHSWCT